MKKFINILVVAVFTCLIVTSYAGNVTTFANQDANHKFGEYEKQSVSHGSAGTVEHDGKHLTFCCQSCANKHGKEHYDKSHIEEELHDYVEYKDHDKY